MFQRTFYNQFVTHSGLMVIEGRRPISRDVARTHRVNQDVLLERSTSDLAIFIWYVHTIKQMGDVLTKGAFTVIQWKLFMRVIQIRSPQSYRVEPSVLQMLAGSLSKIGTMNFEGQDWDFGIDVQ